MSFREGLKVFEKVAIGAVDSPRRRQNTQELSPKCYEISLSSPQMEGRRSHEGVFQHADPIPGNFRDRSLMGNRRIGSGMPNTGISGNSDAWWEVSADDLRRAFYEPYHREHPIQRLHRIGLLVFRDVLRRRCILHGRVERLGEGLSGIMHHPYRLHALVG